jgi:hypothetical protein
MSFLYIRTMWYSCLAFLPRIALLWLDRKKEEVIVGYWLRSHRPV